MEATNKANVRIFGQEYTIAGSASSEQMSQIAEYVDRMMTELGKNLPSLSTLSLAVLSAVNIASDLYESNARIAELEDQVKDLQKEQDGIVKLWEDAKQSFRRYKEEAEGSVDQLQELQRIFNMKNVELNQAKEQLEEMTARYQKAQEEASSSQQIRDQLTEMEEKYRDALGQADACREEAAALRRELEDARRSQKHEDIGLEAMNDKYKDLENSFFDIQMENISLKNELDELKKK